ncbi:uncharacterized protein V1510DRAFT_448284 [Dipodascopsis tothii]|uniref:uncharacterized protein n=1 Tax=Dipodascopsis tothii TaxID=44089 RepID=UPI0034CE4896
MKLIRQEIKTLQYVEIEPQERADLWALYNVVHRGDRVRASTVRRVSFEAATGTSVSQRITLTLEIQVDKIDFDVAADTLHVSGPVISINKHVRKGAYHTLDLELRRPLKLTKEEWDSVSLMALQEACDPVRRADVGAVVLQEGLANICLITEQMTLVRQRLETSIARKRKDSASSHEKGLAKFYAAVYEAMERHFDYDALKAIVVASPGFVGEDLIKYVFDRAVKDENKVLVKSRSKFVRVHASSGHVHALNEVLRSPAGMAQLADTKFAREAAALETLFKTLNDDSYRACYGLKHVTFALDQNAIGTLLVSDSRFRSDDIAERKAYVSLVERVREAAGSVLIFSSMHQTGKQLDDFTGVAAILNFPVPELEDIDDSDSDSDTDGA